jgi:hypothetical protein
MRVLVSKPKNLMLLMIVLFIAGFQAIGRQNKDPHRPSCTDSQCLKIRSFLKTHYCGEFPFGNGPDDGCNIRNPKRMASNINVAADFNCDWNEIEGKSKCQQHGRPSEAIQSILVHEMRRIGLPQSAVRELHFVIWEYGSPGLVLAMGDYQTISGSEMTLCQVIIAIDHAEKVHLLRKVSLQKTNADVPNAVTWSPLDMADINGDGQIEIILRGDDYEDHWFEVDRIKNGAVETIFSGLGYYL